MSVRLRRPLTLRLRLTAITVFSAIVAVILLELGVQQVLSHQTVNESTNLLRARADAAAATVQVRQGELSVLDPPVDSLDQNLWIFDATGSLIDGPALMAPLRSAIRQIGVSTGDFGAAVTSGYRIYARPVRVDEGTPVAAVVVAAVDLSPYESAERRGLVVSLVLGLLIVVGAGTAAWASAGFSLRQVHRMAASAEDWREHDLSRRFHLGPPVDELSELGLTLDRMLDRIAQALRSERRLTDEVAHELRTPLAAIRSEAQLALTQTPGSAATRAALDTIVAATDRMNDAIQTMLDAARSTHSLSERCRVVDVLEDCRAGAPAGDGVSLAVSVAAPDAMLLIAAPQTVVVATVAPLLANAMRHAVSHVSLVAMREAERVLVTVGDDGPGVPADRREEIFEPGYTTQLDGAGLGLALARRLATSIGAEVRAEAAGHGAFTLDLPAG